MAITMKAVLDADTSGFVDGLNQIKNQSGNLSRQLRDMQREIQKMSLAYEEMDDAAKASKFGEYLKEQIDITTAKAAELYDLRGDIQQNIQNLASDTSAWDSVADTIDVTSSSIQAFAASMGIASEDGTLLSDSLNVIVRTQTAANAIIKIGNALQKQSAMMIGLSKVAKTADAVATKIATAVLRTHTGAMVADTAATGAATVATNIFKKALISTGIGAIIVLLGSLIAYWDNICSAVKKAAGALVDGFTAVTDWLGITSEEEREANKAAQAEEERKRKLQEFTDAAYKAVNSEAEQIAKLRQLQGQINNTKLSEEARIKAMKKANEESGKEIYNLKETKKYLNGMDSSINAYINNLVKEAEAKAILNRIGSLYLNQLEIEASRRRGTYGPNQQKQLWNIQNETKYLTERLQALGANTKAYKDYNKAASSTSKSSSTKTKTPAQEAVETLNKANKAYEDAITKANKLKEEYKNRFDIYGADNYDADIKAAKQAFVNAVKANFEYADEPLKMKFNELSIELGDEEIIKKQEEQKKKLEEALQNAKKIDIKTDGEYKYEPPEFFDSEAQKKAAEQTKLFEDKIKEYNDLLKKYKDLEASLLDSNMIQDSDEYTQASKQLDEYNNRLGNTKKVINELADAQTEYLTKQDEAQKKQQKAQEDMENYNAAVSSVSSAMGSLGEMIGGTTSEWLSFAGTAMQSTAQIIEDIRKLIGAKQGEAIASGAAQAAKLTFPANLAAIASIVATIMSTFAAIPSFATGGIFKGSSTIGDKNIARLNGGEIILNNSQQGRLFALLNGMGTVSSAPEKTTVKFRIRGTDLIGTQTNYNKKHSRL